MGPKEVGKVGPGRGEITAGRVRFGGPLDTAIRVETDLSFNCDPLPASVLSVTVCRVHGIHSIIVSHRFPSTPDLERTDISGDDSVTRQRAPVGDSLDDEQCGDHLFNPWPH